MMQKNSFYIISLALLVFAIVLLALISTGESAPKDPLIKKSKPQSAAAVEMTNTMKFTPDTISIEKGQTILWNNTSLLAHSVTGDPSQATIEGSVELPKGADSFDSGMMDPDQTYKHTFNVPGTYQYFCIPHEGVKMYGWIIVEK